MEKYQYELPIELPAEGCTLIYTNGGIVTAAEIKRSDQYVATIKAFIELSEFAAYPVTSIKSDESGEYNCS